MRYIFAVIANRTGEIQANHDEMAAIDAFNERLKVNSHLILAAGIAEPSRAALFDNRWGASIQKTGSLFDGPEHYSGFWIIEADSPEQAQAFAVDGSRACNRRVELRPFLG